ncbi:MAG: MOSC domain-containing protein [Kiloniellales bacterium]|nr:MOSC domain-containing protein [Kiloniellales bacterium]
MTERLEGIYRYPVKGLSAESLEGVRLEEGRPMPGDRRFAIAHGTANFDANDPKWLPKQNFLILANEERLAQLETRFDPESEVLTIFRAGKQVAKGKTSDIMGRTLIGQFFAGFMRGEVRGTPRLIEARGFTFADTPENVLSVVNLASVEDLDRVIRQPVNPLRFRANLLISGFQPWAERSWIGKCLSIGEVRLKVVEEIERCAATNVNPETAARDLNIPLSLKKGYRHMNMGVYAEVVSGGELTAGAKVSLD